MPSFPLLTIGAVPKLPPSTSYCFLIPVPAYRPILRSCYFPECCFTLPSSLSWCPDGCRPYLEHVNFKVDTDFWGGYHFHPKVYVVSGLVTIARWDNRWQNFSRPVVAQFSRTMASFSRTDLNHEEIGKKIEKSVPRD